MPKKPTEETKRKLPKGVKARIRADGVEVFDVYAYEQGEQISLGVRETVDAAVSLRFAYYKAKTIEGEPTPQDLGVLTLRQLGNLYFHSNGKKWDEDRWNARVVGLAEFIDWPITQIAQEHIREWVAKQAITPLAHGRGKGQPPARGTVHSALCLLRRIFKWACMPKQRYLAVNPCPLGEVTISASTDVRLKSKRNLFDYLRESEARKLIDAPEETIPLEPKTKFLVLMFSGARPSDVWRLEWPNVDWETHSIEFGSGKTSHDEETRYVVYMLPQLESALRKWWLASGRPKRGLVFPSAYENEESDEEQVYARGYDAGWSDKRERRHNVWYVDDTDDKSLSADAVHRRFQTRNREQAIKLRRKHGERRSSRSKLVVTKGWRSKLGIERPVPLYALRHTCACHLLLGTELFTGGRRWSREEIQAQLGHKDSSATEHYMRSLGLASRKAVEESRAALKKKRPKDGKFISQLDP